MATEFKEIEIFKMLKTGSIEQAETEGAAPVLFSSKGNGSLPFSINYITLNDVTVRSFYPIMSMIDCIDALDIAVIISTLETNNSYWPAEIDDADLEKRALISHQEPLRFSRMQFRLCNTPGTFQ